MAEVFFYHLERQPLEAVLPILLLKTIERGWRAVVQVGSPERLEALDGHFWTFADEAFLPHGTEGEDFAADQPVLLTTSTANPNGATVRFLVDGAVPPEDLSGYERIVLLFDGNDDVARAAARGVWSRLKAGGHVVTYWQQGARGGWEKKA